MDLNLLSKHIKPESSKIVFLVMDGLGGLPRPQDGLTEVEAASTPHLDELAEESICGLQIPVGSGITPGSGPGHLGLFGYDPIRYQVVRGVLAANGIGFALQDDDIAARGNFCTIDDQGIITDRRAGRISTEKNQELCERLRSKVSHSDVELFFETVKEHRLLLVLRGKNLSSDLIDTDPQETGKKPFPAKATSSEATRTAEIVQMIADQIREILKDEHPANMVLFRGFSKKPCWPRMNECFGLKAAAIAGYPMYRGLSKIIGMDILETGASMEEEFSTLEKHWDEYDFFYLHVKKTDSYGEDGNFEEKMRIIEEVDRYLPRLRALNPDVIVVTGDHSTPSALAFHSWHPVPVMIWSKICRKDSVSSFGERACISGGLGPRLPAVDLMPIALANAHRLDKFGA